MTISTKPSLQSWPVWGQVLLMEALLKAEEKTLTWGFLHRKNTSGVGPVWWVSYWRWTNGLFSRKYLCSFLSTGFFWWTHGVISKTRNEAEAVSFLIMSLTKWRVLDSSDTSWTWGEGGQCPKTGCSGCCPDPGCSEPHGLLLLLPVYLCCEEIFLRIFLLSCSKYSSFAGKQREPKCELITLGF